MSEEFQEKAYKILYEKYRSVVTKLIQDSINHQYKDNGSGKILPETRPTYLEKKAQMFENIGLLEEWSRNGILSKEDISAVKALEYCLGEKGLEKKVK